jgi:hypothetical protein
MRKPDFGSVRQGKPNNWTKTLHFENHWWALQIMVLAYPINGWTFFYGPING